MGITALTILLYLGYGLLILAMLAVVGFFVGLQVLMIRDDRREARERRLREAYCQELPTDPQRHLQVVKDDVYVAHRSR